MTGQLTRRALLGAAPAAALVPAVSLGSSRPAATSIGALFAEWSELRRQFDWPFLEERIGTAAYRAMIDRSTEIEVMILEEPAKEPLDFVIMVYVNTARGFLDLDAGRGHRIWSDADRILERAATSDAGSSFL